MLSRLTGEISNPRLLTRQRKTRSRQFIICSPSALRQRKSAYGPIVRNIFTDVRDETVPPDGHHVMKACGRHGGYTPCLIYLGPLALNTCIQPQAPTALPQRREANYLPVSKHGPHESTTRRHMDMRD